MYQLFYRSRARRHFYGKIMRFGLIFGRMAILKKKLGANYEQLFRTIFSGCQGQKIYLVFKKNIVVSA